MILKLRLAISAAALALAGCVSTHTTADETATEGAAAAPVSPPTPSTAPPPATPTEQPHQAPAVAPTHTPPAEPIAPPEPAPSGQGLGGVSVRFGIAPGDYSDVEPGVLVGEVFPGTSADLAGIRPGDRMTKWNGKPIADVETWMPLLAGAKPGDVVDVTYVRDGKEAVAKVTLQPRQ